MKGKLCPSCGTFNQLSNIFCTGCGEDLLRIPVSEGEGDLKTPAETPKKADGPATYLRKCPKCGKVSPYHVSRCRCGYLLLSLPPYEEGKEETVLPMETAVPKEEETKYLVSEDGRFRLPLHIGDEFYLGRKETGAEYFYPKTFVSGRHLRIQVTTDGVIVEHVGKTNPTLVNNIQIKTNTPYSVSVNDRIVLGARWGQEYVAEAAYLRLVAN